MSEKVKPKCPLCGVPMDRSATDTDPGDSVWECVGHKKSCWVEVMITEVFKPVFDDEEASE